MPKPLVSAAATAQTQQVLGIDAAVDDRRIPLSRHHWILEAICENSTMILLVHDQARADGKFSNMMAYVISYLA
jgi:hypothetical protein